MRLGTVLVALTVPLAASGALLMGVPVPDRSGLARAPLQATCILPEVPLERGDPARGEATFTRAGCIGCHTVRGVGGVIGPELTAVALRAPSRAEAVGLSSPALYFVQSLVCPQAYVVEGYAPVMLDWQQLNLTEQDLADLAAFLATLDGR
jgi:cytochrome c553